MWYRKLVSVLMISAAVAADTKLGSATYSDETFHAEFVSRLDPASPAIARHGQGTLSQDGPIKRHAVDLDHRTYGGYDLRVEPLAGGRVRLRFVELSINPAEMSKIFTEVRDWTRLARPADAPSTLEVRDGETVTVVLYFNPSTGQKVTDAITVRPHHAGR